MVAQTLDRLHDGFTGCETLAFVDLSTQMVLVANSATPCQREDLDALCAEAALLLGTAPALGDGSAETVFVATADHLRIYLRDTRERADALCCICHHDIALDSFVPRARACLDQISHDA